MISFVEGWRAMPMLTIDFFHDVVCCWSFNISSRLRSLVDEFNLDVHHRTFVLQANQEEMRKRWGSPDDARETILEHWAACRQVSDRPELVNIEAMRAAPFHYPHGLAAALGCKAAELIGGQLAHWNLFDRLQRAHLSEAQNVADPTTLQKSAAEIGLDARAFAVAFDEPITSRLVEMDRQRAREHQVRSVPTLLVRETGTRLVNGPREDLAAQLRAALRILA
jgi:putative protein-disulfide isomerase